MTLKQKAKTLKSEDRRGVSPVIGVILMVAITVILAAVIGTFVMGIGGDVNQSPQAGVTFNEQSDGTVDVTINSMPNADEVTVDDGTTTETLTSVGATAEGLSGDITVTATLDGETAVIAEYP